jgi:hypothetical protein
MATQNVTLVWGRSQVILGQRAGSKDLQGRLLQSAFREDLSDYIEQSGFEVRSPMTQESLTFEERRHRTFTAATDALEYFSSQAPLESAVAHQVTAAFRGNSTVEKLANVDQLSFDSFIVRGLGHYCKQQPCQDAIVVAQAPGLLILANADGVSQAPFSHFGARRMLEVVTPLLPGIVQRHSQLGSLLSADFVTDVSMALYDAVHIVCSECHLHPMDAWQLLLPATFKVACITSADTIILGADDGVIDWNGSLIPVEQRIQRLYTGSRNIPILPGRCYAFDHLSDRQTKNMSEEDAQLFEESLSLKVIAYGLTKDVLQHPLGLYSDGIMYARELTSSAYHAHFNTIEAMPLHSIVTGLDTDAQALVELCLLYHTQTTEQLRKGQESSPGLELIRDLCYLSESPSALASSIEQKIRSLLDSYKSPLLPPVEARAGIKTHQLLEVLIINQLAAPDLVRPLTAKLKKEVNQIAHEQLLRFVDSTRPQLCLPLADDFSYVGVGRAMI